MRALLSGAWGDTYLLDVIIGGLKDSNKGFPKETIDIVTNGTSASERGAAMAEARHKLQPRPLDEGEAPQVVFVLHDSLPMDDTELGNIARLLEQGVPVYHVRHLDRETIRRLRGAAGRRVHGARRAQGQPASSPVGPVRRSRKR